MGSLGFDPESIFSCTPLWHILFLFDILTLALSLSLSPWFFSAHFTGSYYSLCCFLILYLSQWRFFVHFHFNSIFVGCIRQYDLHFQYTAVYTGLQSWKYSLGPSIALILNKTNTSLQCPGPRKLLLGQEKNIGPSKEQKNNGTNKNRYQNVSFWNCIQVYDTVVLEFITIWRNSDAFLEKNRLFLVQIYEPAAYHHHHHHQIRFSSEKMLAITCFVLALLLQILPNIIFIRWNTHTHTLLHYILVFILILIIIIIIIICNHCIFITTNRQNIIPFLKKPFFLGSNWNKFYIHPFTYSLTHSFIHS